MWKLRLFEDMIACQKRALKRRGCKEYAKMGEERKVVEGRRIDNWGNWGIVIMGRRAVAEGEEGQAAGKSMPLVPMILMMRQLVDLVLREESGEGSFEASEGGCRQVDR